MKLRSKISIANLIVNFFFLVIAGISLYLIVQAAVFSELDEHLENHKSDLIERFENNEISLQTIDEIGSIGTYEWIELQPVSGSVDLDEDEYSSVSKSRFRGEPAERYRQLRSIILIDGREYILTVYEEIAGWESITGSILIGTLVLLLIWYGVTFFGNEIILRNTLKPFFSTVSKLRGIRSENDFNITFPTVGTDELNELNQALNTMLAELEASFSRQKQFIQNASHELLTPLSIIRHKTDELLNNESLDEESVLEISKIQQTIIRLKKLSNALLTISRVENKHYSTDGDINTQDILTEAISELQAFIENKNITLEITNNKLPVIRGNTELFHSLVYNILQNAVYHTPEQTTITIEAPETEDLLHLVISDSGPGISDEETEKVFERFERSAENGGTGNHGLGLAIVQSICKLHEWNCFFEIGREKGAAFHLIIPADL